MKFIIRFTFMVLTLGLSSNWIHASSFYEVNSLLKIQDTLKVNQDSLTVTVYVSFIVDKKGKVGSVEISKIESDSASVKIIEKCKAEALRTVKTMPKWSPAVENGKRVAVHYNLPVRFKIPGEETGEHKEE